MQPNRLPPLHPPHPRTVSLPRPLPPPLRPRLILLLPLPRNVVAQGSLPPESTPITPTSSAPAHATTRNTDQSFIALLAVERVPRVENTSRDSNCRNTLRPRAARPNGCLIKGRGSGGSASESPHVLLFRG